MKEKIIEFKKFDGIEYITASHYEPISVGIPLKEIIPKILGELRREHIEWINDINESKFDKPFLDYLAEKYGKRNNNN